MRENKECIWSLLKENGKPKVCEVTRHLGIKTFGRIDYNTEELYGKRIDEDMMILAYSVMLPSRWSKLRKRIASTVRNIYIKVVKYVRE